MRLGQFLGIAYEKNLPRLPFTKGEGLKSPFYKGGFRGIFELTAQVERLLIREIGGYDL